MPRDMIMKEKRLSSESLKIMKISGVNQMKNLNQDSRKEYNRK